MNNQQIILHLSLIEGVGATSGWRILQLLKNEEDFLNLYNLNSREISFKFGILPKISLLIYEGLKNREILAKELELIDKHKINWLTLIDKDYPEILKNSYLPPLVIYYQGSNIFSEQSLAVIGSRKINDYGCKTISTIVPELVKNNWVIVSGGAIGADTKAHEQTLKSGGKTIAILGSGLLKPYPYSNKRLFNEIIEQGGAIVSAFNLLMEPLQGNFPARNRIIAGISKGCLVVQAAQKSGTRITATFALEQGKEVFAVPGPIDDELSAGCHSLIKEGAKLVHSAEDVLMEFGMPFSETPLLASAFANAMADRPLHRGERHEESPAPFVVSVCEANVSNHEPEEPLIAMCNTPTGIDELLIKTGLSLQELQAKLFELEIQGKITQNFAGMWEKA